MRPDCARLMQSAATDPWRNLAIEELLMERAAQGARILFLWQAEPVVVIGKNQNPWRECPLPVLRAEGIRLARRFSGGGAVYQDLGNLNFAFFSPRVDYDSRRSFSVVMDALSGLGLSATLTPRNGLEVAGKKISGNAFCFKRGAALHHGTLLVKADLKRLKDGLVRREGVVSHAIESKPDAVMNLSEQAPGLSVQRVAEALKEAYAHRHGGRVEEHPVPDFQETQLQYERLRDWDWVYGHTPDFHITLNRRGVPVRVFVEKGRIVRVEAGEDSSALNECLKTCRFEPEEIAERIQHAGPGLGLRKDWAIWFEGSLGLPGKAPPPRQEPACGAT